MVTTMYVRLILIMIVGFFFGKIENYISYPEITQVQIEYVRLLNDPEYSDSLTSEELQKIFSILDTLITPSAESQIMIGIAVFLLFMIVSLKIQQQQKLLYGITLISAFFFSFSFFISSFQFFVYSCIAFLGLASGLLTLKRKKHPPF